MIKRRMFLAVTALAISGCPNGAKAPSAADLAAGVELGAVVVHTVDLACAGAAKGLRDAGKTEEAATLAGTCVKALRDAQAGLEGQHVRSMQAPPCLPRIGLVQSSMRRIPLHRSHLFSLIMVRS